MLLGLSLNKVLQLPTKKYSNLNFLVKTVRMLKDPYFYVRKTHVILFKKYYFKSST